MRIALVTPEYPGCGSSFGVGAYVQTLAQGLAAHQHHVVVLAATAAGRFRIDLPAGIVSRRGDARGPVVARPWLAGRWLGEELAACQPEVVEFSNWGGLAAAVPGHWRTVVRLSSPISVSTAPDALRRLAARVHHWNELATVRRADLVISDSRAMGELSSRAYGRSADRIIPHAWDGELTEPAGDAGDVLCVGRLQERKGTDTLVAAWPSIHRQHPGTRLHLVGADQHGFGARQLQLHGRAGIEAYGEISEDRLADVRRRCIVQVVPSRFESFGLVVLEAWAAGLAPVVSTGGALPEVAGDGGLVVPAEDVGGFSEAMLRLLEHQDHRDRLVRVGRRRLSTLFTTEAVVRATVDAYRSIVQR